MASDGEPQYETLRFQPWNSAPDVTFWQKLATLKLNTFQLNDQAQVRRLRYVVLLLLVAGCCWPCD